MRVSVTLTLTLIAGLMAATASAKPRLPHNNFQPTGAITCASCHVEPGTITDRVHRQSGAALSGTETTLTGTGGWALDQWRGGVVVFTSSTYAGKWRQIQSNTADTLLFARDMPGAVGAGTTYVVWKNGYSDIETKCAGCHNPTGVVAGPTPKIHLTDIGEIGCGKCHDPHNVDLSSGSSTIAGGGGLIRRTVRFNGGRTAVYDPTAPEGTRFVNGGGTGICQTCHTRTAYYRNDGSRQTHDVGQNCLQAGCHEHATGFFPASILAPGAGGHFDSTRQAWSSYVVGANRQACLRCHNNAGFRDYVGADGTADNHASGSFMADTIPGTAGTLKCESCHNPAADALSDVVFVSQMQATGLNKQTAICTQCHQGRETTSTLASRVSANVATADRGLGALSNTTDAAGTTTTLTRTATAWPVDRYKGYKLLFTTGAHKDTWVAVSSNTADTMTFAPALGTPTASGEGFTLWPVATGGALNSLADTNRAWTAGQWVSFYLYVQTGPNAGLYRRITANTATTLTLSGNFAAPIAAGTLYQIVTQESSSVLDSQIQAAGQGFLNLHYLAAGATMFGSDAAVGAQYPVTMFETALDNMTAPAIYTTRNFHGVSKQDCTSCHDPHTLHVKETECGGCHFKADGTPVTTLLELEEERQFGFEGDIDGDGDAVESLKLEIDGLAVKLYAAIQAYGAAGTGGSSAICFTTAAHPYWFYDNNPTNGVCDAAEAVSANAYKKFTPRLHRAAFNYNYVMHEPGAWAHNPKYMIELLWDGLYDLNKANGTPITVASNGFRGFRGHFGAVSNEFPSTGLQFSDWDNAVVPANCSQCHAGANGFRNYLANPMTNTTNRPVRGMQCTTCHDPLATDTDMSRFVAVSSVRFPPRPPTGVTPVTIPEATFADPKDAICATCHGGRETGATVDASLVGTGNTSFKNVHYFAAAASMLGDVAKVGYQYAGKTYAGIQMHHGQTASCMECHDPVASRHTFEVATIAASKCATAGCHADANYAAYKAAGRGDYDGDAVAEDLAHEIEGLGDKVYEALRVVAAASPGGPICYNGGGHPYFFKDNGAGGGTAGDGICQAGETSSYSFPKSVPSLLRGAFNYQVSHKEPGWAHNFNYVAQLLYDSIEDLGGNLTGLTRP